MTADTTMSPALINPVLAKAEIESYDKMFNTMGIEHPDLAFNIDRLDLLNDEEFKAKQADFEAKMPKFEA